MDHQHGQWTYRREEEASNGMGGCVALRGTNTGEVHIIRRMLSILT